MLEPVLVLHDIRGKLPSYACIEKIWHLSSYNPSLHICCSMRHVIGIADTTHAYRLCGSAAMNVFLEVGG